MNPFAEILRLVAEDPTLAASLAAEPTEEKLFAAVVALGRERGLDISPAGLTEIVRANRRAWLERWVEDEAN